MNDLQQMLAARAMNGLHLTGGEDVLDVGCGDGRVTAAIAARVPQGRVLGLDRSPAMIATANRHAERAANLRFDVGDATTLTHRDEFDLVVSFNVLHWIPEQLNVLRRFKEALRQDGSALLVFVCDGDRPSLEDVAMQVTTRPGWHRFYADYEPPYIHVQPEAYAATAAAAGLQLVESSVVDLNWDFGSADAFAAWCRVGFGDWLERLPSDEADRFVADVLDSYASVVGSRHTLAFLQLRVALAIDRTNSS